MGSGDIKYGDTFVFLQHKKTGFWLSYQTFETKKIGVGRVEEKKARNISVFIVVKFLTEIHGIISLLNYAIGASLFRATHNYCYPRPASSRGGGFCGVCVCLSVCLSVCPHDISKTAEARITKIGMEMLYHESWEPIFWSRGQRLTSRGTKIVGHRRVL